MKQQQQALQSKPRKTLSVIVLTYNKETPRSEKQSIQNDKSLVDFRSSAFKETEVDPLEFPKNEFNSIRDDELIAQLNRRINDLESRVQVLETKEGALDPTDSKTHRIRKHKVRRHNWQMKRDKACIHCGKCYGTNTALKYHLKLKHQEEREEKGENEMKEMNEMKDEKEMQEEKEGKEGIQ